MSRDFKFNSSKEAYSDVVSMNLPEPKALDEESIKKVRKFDDIQIDNVPDNEVIEYMKLFIGFQAYAEWELSKADIERDVAESTQHFTKVELLLQAPSTFTSVKEKEAWVYAKKVMMETEKSRLQINARYQLLKALAKGYEKKASVCSRELSRRTSGLNQAGAYST